MAKMSKITLKSDISKEELENLDQILDESLSASIGDSEYEVSDTCDKKECSENVNSKNIEIDSSFNSSVKEFGEKTLEEKMNDIHNEFLEDATITIANIKDIAFREAAIKGRWCSRLMAERVRKRRLIQALNSLIEELNEIANSNISNNGSYLAGRRNVKNIIDTNPEVIALRKEISESNEIEKYLSDLNECIRGLGYTVKNSLDVLNLERGI